MFLLPQNGYENDIKICLLTAAAQSQKEGEFAISSLICGVTATHKSLENELEKIQNDVKKRKKGSRVIFRIEIDISAMILNPLGCKSSENLM